MPLMTKIAPIRMRPMSAVVGRCATRTGVSSSTGSSGLPKAIRSAMLGLCNMASSSCTTQQSTSQSVARMRDEEFPQRIRRDDVIRFLAHERQSLAAGPLMAAIGDRAQHDIRAARAATARDARDVAFRIRRRGRGAAVLLCPEVDGLVDPRVADDRIAGAVREP